MLLGNANTGAKAHRKKHVLGKKESEEREARVKKPCKPGGGRPCATWRDRGCHWVFFRFKEPIYLHCEGLAAGLYVNKI